MQGETGRTATRGADGDGECRCAGPDDARPVVAHCASPFLEPTTGWIHDQIRTLTRYRAVALTQVPRDLGRYPVERLVDMSGQGVSRLCRRAVRRARGTYAGYGPVLRREEVAVMHAHFGQEGYRCLSGKRAAKVPMVTTFYGVDAGMLPRIPEWRRRFSRLFAEGEAFLAEGPCMAQRLVAIGCPAGKVREQRLGVDLGRLGFRPPSARVGPPVVLMCASLREKKGHTYGLQAFARLLGRFGERLDVIGDGPLRSALEAEASRLELGERVRFLGMQPHEAYVQAMTGATVLLSPSVTASDGDSEGGAPVVLIEALALGVPVVATRHADVPVVVPDGICGILADERDVGGLADGLAAMLEDGALREKLARAGRAHVEEHHDVFRQARKLEGVYDGLTGRGSSA